MKAEPKADPKSQASSKENSETKKGKKDMPETKEGEKDKTEKNVEGETVALRSLTMEDLRQAKDQVSCYLQLFAVNINRIAGLRPVSLI